MGLPTDFFGSVRFDTILYDSIRFVIEFNWHILHIFRFYYSERKKIARCCFHFFFSRAISAS